MKCTILWGKRKRGSLSHRCQTVEEKGVGFALQEFPKCDHLIHVIFGQGQHHHRMDVHLAKQREEPHRPFEMSLPADVVIMLRQAFETDLEKIKRLNGLQSFNLFFIAGVPQHVERKTEIGGRLIHGRKIRVQKRIASGEGNLPADAAFPAEMVHFTQNSQGLRKRQRIAIVAVVTMPAMKIAGLRDVQLQGKRP